MVSAEPSSMGEVASTNDGGATPYRLRPLVAADLPAVHVLHNQAHAAVPTPGLIARETPEFFADHLQRVGRMYGIEIAGALVAYCVLGLPVGDDYNFGVDLGLPPADLAAVAQLDGAVVQREWQGLGFQRAMVAWRIERAAAFGRRIILSTAAPTNHRSWHTLMLNGLVAVALKRKFGGHWRYLLRRDLDHPSQIDRSRAVILPVDTLERQQALFATGWVGYERPGEPPPLQIAFAPPVEL